MLSKDWVYENIFKLSEGESDEERVKMLDDLKDRFRFRSIEDEGSDPEHKKMKLSLKILKNL